jgi:hypothetical protein
MLVERKALIKNSKNEFPVIKITARSESRVFGMEDSPMFEREDWTAFRTIQGLCRKAGADQDELASVVIKELTDNGLDASGDCETFLRDGVVVVRDRGPGIEGDDETIGRLFSIRRPLISSKLLRMPTRGALGNGLRVVVGAVVATEGKLFVTTRGRIVSARPNHPWRGW